MIHMKICGIVVEYNPFHNGHIYHIQKARELTNCDLLIAVMSGNFSQRGDVMIDDKFKRTEAALKNGVDLILEFPFAYTVQNASIFANASIDILKRMGIDTLVFGSETNNLEELKEMADFSINVNHLQEIMKTGYSYPKAYGLLAGSLYPNDILGIAYLKALKETDITPLSIKRTNEYHSNKLEEIASGKAIREALQNGLDIQMATPMRIEDPHFNHELYPYLRTLLLTSNKEDLQKIHLVSEGIENLLIKNAQIYDDYDEFIQHSITRRYTKARIQRTLLQIMMQNKKEDLLNLPKEFPLRILGFNEKGQQYLSSIKEDVSFISLFKHLPQEYKDLEWKSDLLYASLMDQNRRKAFLKRELQGPVIIKE